MSIALHAGPARPSFARSIAKPALAILILALAVAAVAFVRTFVFEYFHGDPAPIHGLVRLLLGN
jgi:hypothetical protein